MKTRRPDGKPETAADRRFFDLREAGYRGPIDQDGNKVDDLDAWMTNHRTDKQRDKKRRR
jgi:hypothetical protein